MKFFSAEPDLMIYRFGRFQFVKRTASTEVGCVGWVVCLQFAEPPVTVNV